MKDYSLHEPHEIRGHWWVPAHQNEAPEKIAGTLTYTPDNGIALRLHGALSDELRKRTATPIPVVHGDAGGQLVTLIDCYTTQSSYGFGATGMEPRDSTIWASHAFVGAHIRNHDDARIERVYAEIQNLASWMWTAAFNIQRDSQARSHIIEMNLPDSIVIELEGGANAGIVYSAAGPNWNIMEGHLTASVTPAFFYKTPDTLKLDQAMVEVRQFQHFITMAVGKPCSIISIQAVLANEDSDDAREWYERLVSVIYQPSGTMSSGRPVHPGEMVFSYDDIADLFGKYLRNWLGADEDIRTIQNLYFSTRYHSDMFIDTRFMYLVQALESFHRLRFDSRAMDEGDYGPRVSKLLKGLQDDPFKQLARRALAYGNRKSLNERLVELADHYGKILSATFGGERDDFLRKVTRTRHYRTHFDPEGKRGILEGPELVQAYHLMRIMMEVCFLVEMGMEPNGAQDLMAGRSEYGP